MVHWFLEVCFGEGFGLGIGVVVVDGVIDFNVFAEIEHVVADD